MCEMRKRIVARAHDHNSIATTRQLNQRVTAAATVWKSNRMTPLPFNVADNVAASNAAVDGTAEIYRLRHEQNVLIVQPVHKAIHEGISHQTNRAVAMRLKHHQQAAGKRVQGLERSRNLVGVVSKVVDHRNLVGSAHDLQSSPDTAELALFARSRREVDATNLRDTQGGKGIGDVVQPRHFQLHGDALAAVAGLYLESNSGRHGDHR